MDFALNHMTTPRLRWDQVLDLAASLGCIGVEFRNDLPEALFDGAAPEAVAEKAEALGLRVFALAEVKMFNDWSDAKADEAVALMRTAKACSAEAVSLIPRNDAVGTEDGVRQANLRRALTALKPMLEDHDLRGLVEPLGFSISSLRSKSETVAEIDAVGGQGVFALVHDTFHHHIAGDGAMFAGQTGVVHISGVTNPGMAVGDMTDAHRGLVDANDRLDNIAQLRRLLISGYEGAVSFEAFAAEVHALDDPHAALARSMDFIRTALAL